MIIVYIEVTRGIARLFLFMNNLYIGIFNHPERRYTLVNESRKFRRRTIFQQPLPIKFECRIASLIHSRIIFHHIRIGGIFLFFQIVDFFTVFPLCNVVGIDPHEIISARFWKSIIPCGGKIIYPFEIEYFFGKPSRNFFRFVDTPRINYDYFIRKNRNRFKTSPDYFFFVSCD